MDCLGPTQGREVGFLRTVHTQTGKEDWLLFQRLWSPQENCQGDGPTEAGCQPLSCKALWFEETIEAASEDPQGKQGGAPALSLREQKDCRTQSLDWPLAGDVSEAQRSKGEAAKGSQVFGGRELMEVQPPGGSMPLWKRLESWLALSAL